MLGRTYDSQTCSIARTLELVGDRWTLLLLRDVLLSQLTRFTDFQRSLGVATNVLDDRLSRLVDDGILTRRRYAEQPVLDEYLATSKGADLLPVLLALSAWGDTWAAPDGVPIVYRRDDCDGEVHLEMRCSHGDVVAGVDDLHVEVGPGMSASRVELMAGIRASRARDPRLGAA